MTVESFLNELLESQNLTPEQEHALEDHKREVTEFLREEFGAAPVIKYAGSREKGTMIRDRYDLDIVCYFPSHDPRTLKEIRRDVSAHLQKKYAIEPRASAERIENIRGTTAPYGYHIDVVPGRFIEGTKDVFLHVAYGEKERIQTNLKVHIDYIVTSGCVPPIRLAKLWAHRNSVAIKTFILELFVVRALSGSRNKGNLKEAFRELLEAFKDEFGGLELVDPANSNNVVSRSLSSSEKTMVANAAKTAWDRAADSDDISVWKEVFRDNDQGGLNISMDSPPAPAIVRSPSQGFTPRSPWGNRYVDGTK